jgi:hypothetical protein
MLIDVAEVTSINSFANVRVRDENGNGITEHMGVDIVGHNMDKHYFAFIDRDFFGEAVIFIPHSRIIEISIYEEGREGEKE